MKRFALLVAFVIACVLVLSLSIQAAPYASGRILVKFKPGTPAATVAAVHRQNGSAVVDEIRHLGVQKVTAPKGKEGTWVRKYASNPNVQFAEPDYLAHTLETVPNDPWYQNYQWGFRYIGCPAAWDITTGSSSIIVAVVDTGVDYTHPDLAGRIMKGYDFYGNDSDPMDENGHGTQIAGIIGAITNNATGVAGITWQNPVMPIKVWGSTSDTSYSIIANGIVYAVNQGARVINMSFGGPSSSTLKAALDYAYSHGAVLVAAAGNSGVLGIEYPAAYDNVIAVGASDGSDQRRSLSNYGPQLDVLAPDVTMSTRLYGGYGTMGGTSMSAAYVSGLCGLILSANPALSPSQVMQIVMDTADDIAPAGWDQYSGYGRINAYKAVVQASRGCSSPPVDTTPPLVSITEPIADAVLAGPVTLSASASDDTGVAKVEFYVDSLLIASVSQQPFSTTWDTSKTANGTKTVSAKAYDAAGNVGTSAPVSVFVNNPISTTYTYTGSLSTKTPVACHSVCLAGLSTINASLTWTSKANLDLYLLDPTGKVIASSQTSGQSETVSTGPLPAGNYQLKVVCISGKTRYTVKATCTPQ